MKSQEFETIAPGTEHVGFGLNRTGIMLNPEMSLELIDGTKKILPRPVDRDGDVIVDRARYLHEALPIGSRPGIVDRGSGVDPSTSNGGAMAVLFDKLGERLAFERQGTRFYEAFLDKLQAKQTSGPGPSLDDLRHICDEELEHFKLLQHAITELGGDPTVQTPSADVAGVLSHGVLQIVIDPRTTIAQTLEAVLNAELADNDGWEMLAHLAGELGHSDLEEKCEKAFDQEQEHLANVRAWLTEMTLDEALTDPMSSTGNGAGEEADGARRVRKQPKRANRVRKRGTSKRRKK
jgi:rubrerythrin